MIRPPAPRATIFCRARRVAQNAEFSIQSAVPNQASSASSWTRPNPVDAAGVVDQDVELAVVLGGPVDERLDLGLDHRVAGDEEGVVAGRHLLQGLLALGLGAAVDDDLRALGQEGLGDAAADPARAHP